MISTMTAVLKRVALLAPLCLLVTTAGGCIVAGAVLSKVGPEPTVPAQYVPKHDELLVLVENYHNPADVAVVSEHINRLIAEELIAHKVAPVINPDRLTKMRTSTPESEYGKMKIPAIGRSLGASQVVYADVVQFSTESSVGNDMIKAHAEARVRVVDCSTGNTLWPTDMAGGYPVTVDLPYLPTGGGTTESTVREKMAQRLSERVAKLFYNATVDQIDGTEPHLETPDSGITGRI